MGQKGYIPYPWHAKTNLINSPIVVSEGILIKPSFNYLINLIIPVGLDDNNNPFKLTRLLLSHLGFDFKYDNRKKAECALSPYLILWYDSKEQAYFGISKRNSPIYIRTFDEFQEAFCFCFCHYFKPYHDFHLLELIVRIDKATLIRLS